MADDLDISYSFETTPTPGPEKSTDLYAFVDCELIGIDSKFMLVINRQNGRQQLMAPAVVEGLKICSNLATLDEHAQNLAAARPELGGNKAVALSVLNNLKDGGMLLGAQTLCDRLNASSQAKLAPTRVFAITCDRPKELARLLESLLRVGNLSSHDALFVIDDSRASANREANREAVEKFNITSAKNMHYVGAAEQASFLQELTAQLPDHEPGVRFLMDAEAWTGRPTFGRSRNLCLLLSEGYRAIVMDDDIVCEAIHSPITEEGIAIGDFTREAAFFPSRDELMASAPRANFDPLSGHARLLGSTVGNAIGEYGMAPLAPAALKNVNAALANVLQADSPILVTQCGAWGDPGTGNAHWALHMNNNSIDRLATAPHGMSQALENRLNWFGATRPSISKMATLSQMTGLDNTALLPPYFPAFRGEDLLFGAMVVALHHQGAVLTYPWSVPHLPEEKRTNRGLREPIAGAGGTVLFARYLTETIDYKDAAQPEARLHNLAQDMRRLAGRSTNDLLLDYRRELGKIHAWQLHAVATQLRRARDLPSSNWQGYLQRAQEELQRALSVAHSPTEITGSSHDSDEVLVTEFRRLARGFAAGLDAWPAMRAAAEQAWLASQES